MKMMLIQRTTQNVAGKRKAIAKYAASLVRENDFIYLDAGTTTEMMIDHISFDKRSFCYKWYCTCEKTDRKRIKNIYHRVDWLEHGYRSC